MAKQVVDTEKISSCISKLSTANRNMDRKFSSLNSGARRLDSSWNSSAGDKAVTKMYQILKNGEVRSQVIQNYINTLQQQVNPGYTNAEDVNTKLADQFK